MRDGVEIALVIYRPDTRQPAPTLYAAGPFPPASTGSLPDPAGTGPVQRLVSSGYNVVLANVRGTGQSGGSFDFLGRDEQQDHYELVEWIAGQSWSDGQVAGLGSGYHGTTQWLLALQNPPHLRCIAPVNGIIDPYAHWAWKGGLASDELARWYEREIRERHVYSPALEPVYLDFDLRLQQLRHATQDAWWTLRSAVHGLGQIQVPILQAGSWRGGPGSWLGALHHLQDLPANAYTYIGAGADLLQNEEFLTQELLPWYQWCFNGRPRSGPALWPALRYQPVDGGGLRASNGWPPANINYTPLFLAVATAAETAMGRLDGDQERPGRNSVLIGRQQPSPAAYRSGVLERDIDFAGPVVLELYLSSEATDTAIRAELFSENAGEKELISSGALKASMREIAPAPNDARQFRYTLNNPQPLYPGRVYRLDLALDPAARRLAAGSRLLLEISQVSDASLRRTPRTDSLYHTGQFPSRLWLPLAADARLDLRPDADAAPGEQDSIFIMDSFAD